MADGTTESIAADLAELIYERWLSGLRAKLAAESRCMNELDADLGCLDALATLIDGLRMSELDPQTGALQLRAAVEVLAAMPSFPAREEFQRLLAARIAGESARYARRTATRG